MKKNDKFWKKILKSIFKLRGFLTGIIFGLIIWIFGFFELVPKIPKILENILGFPILISSYVVVPIVDLILCKPRDYEVFGCLQAIGPAMIIGFLLSILFYGILGVLIEKLILFLIKLKKRGKE